MDNSKGVGRKIRERRRMLDINQWELALRVGVTQSYISNVENGYVLPDNKMVVAIENALNENREAVPA